MFDIRVHTDDAHIPNSIHILRRRRRRRKYTSPNDVGKFNVDPIAVFTSTRNFQAGRRFSRNVRHNQQKT